MEGLPVCHIDDIIRSKEAANRVKDRESLPRLEAFARYLAFHNSTYGHVVTVTWEPVFDMDRAFEATIRDLK